eukprot:CAMPEP_0118719708 /NCGR_PEP_ID=MMETSP0800-20121206/29661_1 /TAXON_ID=210618 ORGANISM="Striatella unipunctata, Strain CCMP2910" /NCGR_SAMPLE_ID=MMETSP0800 /ASSEMBLY_ACC=CAM_ASM_000638 /LENGTH=190 /DNA_ID=CAMNT_0006627179 /DNA_START=9 /DNA_END=582 /DNA_ORIENTATION=+
MRQQVDIVIQHARKEHQTVDKKIEHIREELGFREKVLINQMGEAFDNIIKNLMTNMADFTPGGSDDEQRDDVEDLFITERAQLLQAEHIYATTTTPTTEKKTNVLFEKPMRTGKALTQNLSNLMSKIKSSSTARSLKEQQQQLQSMHHSNSIPEGCDWYDEWFEFSKNGGGNQLFCHDHCQVPTQIWGIS